MLIEICGTSKISVGTKDAYLNIAEVLSLSCLLFLCPPVLRIQSEGGYCNCSAGKGVYKRKANKTIKKEGIQNKNLTKAKTLLCGFYHLNPHLISKWHAHTQERTNGILFGLADVLEEHAQAGTTENRKSILSNIKHTIIQILTEILDVPKVEYIKRVE